MSAKDYKKLYKIQNSVLELLKPVLNGFYLTGGTALGRFYLNHRFSEDLDFFVNADPDFKNKLKPIENKLHDAFSLLRGQTVAYEDFTRFYIESEDVSLKIEFINDVPYRCGHPLAYAFGLIDTPLNILSNKITAIVGRDEPKDIFDIYRLAQTFHFNWMAVFAEAKHKAIINEIDVEQRIKNFPVDMLTPANWFIHPFEQEPFAAGMLTIANDFLLGRDNSLSSGINPIPIENAQPVSAFV